MNYNSFLRVGYIPYQPIQEITKITLPKWIPYDYKNLKIYFTSMFHYKLMKTTFPFTEFWQRLFPQSSPDINYLTKIFNNIPQLNDAEKFVNNNNILVLSLPTTTYLIIVVPLKMVKKDKSLLEKEIFDTLGYLSLFNTNTNYIGVLLPFHNTFFWLTYNDWDKQQMKKYYQLSNLWTNEKITQNTVPDDWFWKYNVGFDLSKMPANFPYQNKPVQLCSGSNFRTGGKIIVHSPTTINLSDPSGSFIKTLTDTYQEAKTMGAIAYVLHVGKYLENDWLVARQWMLYHCINLLDIIDDNCPICIETPAGQGTEMLVEISEFIEFIKEEKLMNRFKVCVDSCHVFSLGYDPLWYLQKIISSGITVQCVHFNDSINPIGALIDRHAYPGKGYVGLERSNNFISWLNDNHPNIPIVVEASL